jgi:hypothetical protein
MSITIKGASSGGVDIVAPASGSDVTLTLPSTTATVETTASSIASSRLTGALPAISGASLTNLPAGGVDGIVSTANATAITIDSDEATTFASNKAGWGMDFTNSNASGYGLKISAGSGTNHALKVRDKDSNELLVVHGNGNMGLGVEPESWHTSMTAIQLGQRASIATWNDDAELNHCANVYYDGSWKYIASDYATLYTQAGNGKHKFSIADSVPNSANTAATLVDVMVINATGNCAHTYTGGGGGMTINRSDSSGAATLMQFFTGGNLRGHIDYNGSATVYYTSSDYRLKENVVPLPDSIDRLMQLKPSRFNFIENPTMDMDGFIAHEVQSIVPEAISGQKDDMEDYEVTPAVLDDEKNVVEPAVMGTKILPQGIDQSKLVPLLTAALQDAIKRIEILENA